MADPAVPQLPPRGVQLGAENTAQLNSYYRATRDANYKAFIISTDQKILVDAWLPETVGTDVSAQYEAPFSQGLTGQLGPTVGALARFLGASLVTQAMTIQVWQGGAFIEFLLPLIFQAETSAAKEVMQPIKDLLKLTMPVDSSAEGGGFLTAPGPVIDPDRIVENGISAFSNVISGASGTSSSLLSAGTNLLQGNVGSAVRGVRDTANQVAQPLNDAIFKSIKNNISLYIGQFLYFPSVIITDVSPVFDVTIGPDNNPTRATVNVTFRTFYMPTNKDIELMFPMATDKITGGGAYTNNTNGFGNDYAENYG